jgi:hypothetical protein
MSQAHLPRPTLNRQIRSLVLRVDLVGSSRIWAAQVGCLVDPDGSRRVPSDRLDDHRDDQVPFDSESDGSVLERHVHLALGAEAGERRFATGAYGFWRAHVHALLAAAGEPAAGRDALVEVLLAPLATKVYQYQRQGRSRTPAEITGALVRLARAVLGPPQPG